MEIIQDGTGKGYTAKVNEYNQISVISESSPSEGVQAKSGLSFIIAARCDTAAAASGGLLYIKNNETAYNIEITRIYTYSHVLTPTDLIITQVFDPTPSSGTDKSTTAIIQKNRGATKELDATVTISDSSADMTYTGGEVFHEYPLPSMTMNDRNMNGTNILSPGKAMLFGYFTDGGGNATDGEHIFFSVNVIKRAI